MSYGAFYTPRIVCTVGVTTMSGPFVAWTSKFSQPRSHRIFGLLRFKRQCCCLATVKTSAWRKPLSNSLRSCRDAYGELSKVLSETFEQVVVVLGPPSAYW